MLTHRSTALQTAALELVQAGWAVLPCWPTGSRAKSPVSALVPHGHLDASHDPDVIRRWWQERPNALIGGVVPPSMLVLDVDPRNGGSVQAIERLVGTLPQTLTVWSGRNDGGRHLYFLRPPGGFSSTRLPVGVDLKAHGYCIVPPSPHPATAAAYRWELHDPAALPSRLRALLRPHAAVLRQPRSTANDSMALAGFVAALAPGRRNEGTFWALCRAIEDGVGGAALADLVAAALATGLTEREVAQILKSATRTAGARP